MKTTLLNLVICLLISYSLSAQTKNKTKLDSIKIGYLFNQKILKDTLKLRNPFNENNIQSPYSKFYFPKQGSNLAWIGQPDSSSQYKMPIVRPNFKSNMPVMKPDSSIHFFLQIKKIKNE